MNPLIEALEAAETHACEVIRHIHQCSYGEAHNEVQRLRAKLNQARAALAESPAPEVAYRLVPFGDTIQEGDMTVGEDCLSFIPTEMEGCIHDESLFVHFRPVHAEGDAPVPSGKRYSSVEEMMQELPKSVQDEYRRIQSLMICEDCSEHPCICMSGMQRPPPPESPAPSLRDNILGRIAISVFGDDNNITDEECVTGVAAMAQRLKQYDRAADAEIVELVSRCQRGEATCLFTAQAIEGKVEQVEGRLAAMAALCKAWRKEADSCLSTGRPLLLNACARDVEEILQSKPAAPADSRAESDEPDIITEAYITWRDENFDDRAGKIDAFEAGWQASRETDGRPK